MIHQISPINTFFFVNDVKKFLFKINFYSPFMLCSSNYIGAMTCFSLSIVCIFFVIFLLSLQHFLNVLFSLLQVLFNYFSIFTMDTIFDHLFKIFFNFLCPWIFFACDPLLLMHNHVTNSSKRFKCFFILF